MHWESAMALCGALAATVAPVQAEELVNTRALAEHTISCGSANRGALRGIALPVTGIGYAIGEPWLNRDTNYGTAELVGAVQRAAYAVETAHPGATLGVADMSGEYGGPLLQHRSHQNGRDVDLLYYALDEFGDPFRPDGLMPYFNGRGAARYATSPSFERNIVPRFFDLARNWALIRALVTDPQAEVERIFVSNRIRRWLLRYAQEIGEDENVLAAARYVLRRANVSQSHNDHMHVRIACSAQDVDSGRCKNDLARRARRSRWRRRVACGDVEIATR